MRYCFLVKQHSSRRTPGIRADIAAKDVIGGAVAVYRTGGVAAVSMRSVAAAIGVAPNALYSHVRSKDELIAELVDVLLGEIPLSDPHPDWREGLVHLMSDSRTVLLKYGDLMPFLLSRPTRGANAMRLGERCLDYLHAAGLAGDDAVESLRILLVYTVGFVAQEYPRLTDSDGDRRVAASRDAFSRGAGMPRTRTVAANLARHPDDGTFETGLRWIVDGIASLGAPRVRSKGRTAEEVVRADRDGRW